MARNCRRAQARGLDERMAGGPLLHFTASLLVPPCKATGVIGRSEGELDDYNKAEAVV